MDKADQLELTVRCDCGDSYTFTGQTLTALGSHLFDRCLRLIQGRWMCLGCLPVDDCEDVVIINTSPATPAEEAWAEKLVREGR